VNDKIAVPLKTDTAGTLKVTLGSAAFDGTLPPRLDGSCLWRIDGMPWDWNVWAADCGLLWDITDGTPRENEMNYCPKCGRVLVQVDVEEEE